MLVSNDSHITNITVRLCPSISAAMTKDTEAISALLKAYEHALNTDSTDAAVKCYAPDAIAMFQHFPPVVGIDNIKDLYDNTFKAISLRVEFTIHEVNVIDSEWAWARTASAGTQTVHATGAKSKEGNSELFVLKKDAENWKIARYCFCTVNPPK